MIIHDIAIENFRSCKALQLTLNRFCALVGYNNTGKSNSLRAIDFVFNPPEKVDSEYFWNDTIPIRIDITLKEANNQNVSRSSFQKTYCDANHRLQFRCERKLNATENTYLIRLPKSGQWIPLKAKEVDTLRELFPQVTYLNAVQGIAQTQKNPTRLEELILAARNAITNNSANSEQAAERERLFLDDLNTTLSLFYPGLIAKITADAQGDAVIEQYYTQESRRPRPVKQFDAVYIHAVRMAILTFLSHHKEKIKLKRDVLLMLDEPELHLHPVMVDVVSEALIQLSHIPGVQIILTTHSPVIVQNAEAFVSTKVIKKSAARGTYTTTKHISNARMTTAVQKFINLSNSSYALFASRVILVEGEIDKLLLGAIVKKAYPSLSPRVGFVVSDGNNLIEALYKICESLGLSPRGVTDLDHLKAYETSTSASASLRELVYKIKLAFNDNRETPTLEWPSRASQDKSRDAFIRLGKKHPDLVRDVHEKALKQGIWLWPTGDIEAVFGFRRHTTIEEARGLASRILRSVDPWETTVMKTGGDVKLLTLWLRWALKSIEA